MKKFFHAALLLFITGYCTAQADNNESSKGILSATTIKKELLLASQDIKLYPNPAKNKITIQVSGFAPGMLNVRIIDSKGKLLRQDSRLLISGTEEVPMFLALEHGVYYVMVDQKDKSVKKRLAIL